MCPDGQSGSINRHFNPQRHHRLLSTLSVSLNKRSWCPLVTPSTRSESMVLTQGWFVSSRALIISADFLGCQNQKGKSSYWHRVSRGQSCCQRSSNVLESPHSPSKELPNRKSQFNFQFKPRMRTSVLEWFTNSMGFGSRQAWSWLYYNCQRALGK